MTALFEMHIRVGGDPRGFGEFTALRDELAKLSHPACPDVDWARVEQLCLALFQHNGAELQSACAYALARSRCHGLAGMVQGLALIEALGGEWSRLWPPMASVRLDILAWLFAQLQPLLRSLTMTTREVPELARLYTGLERLNQRLVSQTQVPLFTLQALRHQVSSLIQRLERSHSSAEAVHQMIRVTEPAQVWPVVILPPPPMPVVKTRRRPILRLLAVTALFALASGLGWREWQAGPGSEGVRDSLRLDSLSLFDAGSAQLKPDSTKVLINALDDIKAQPGLLIVIAGHTDSTGVAEQNLQLSYARASAVRDWMRRMGDIAESCFAVQGFAASQPIASNDTEAGRTANRRVDIHLVPQVGACEPPTLGANG